MTASDAIRSLQAIAKSRGDALWAIANMQILESTDRGEVLALCMSIAKLELSKKYEEVTA